MKYIVLDLETSIKCPIGNNKASPHWRENNIVMTGLRINSSGVPGEVMTRIVHNPSVPTWPADEDMLWVGHNIKFDLLYLLHRDEHFRKHIFPRIKVWDTQLTEYILSGQEETWASLDTLSLKYGGTLKDDKIKAYWNAGIDTELIPKDELAAYLVEDLKNTEYVFLNQLAIAVREGKMPLLTTQMEALLATTEMEYNGMRFDSRGALGELSRLVTQKDLIEERLLIDLRAALPLAVPANLNSKKQLSYLFFGGEIEYTEYSMQYDEQGRVIMFKSGDKKGSPKLKKETKTQHRTAHRPMLYGAAKTKTGDYVVDEDVLKNLSTSSSNLGTFADALLEYRKLEKETGTYYKPYIDLTYPDGCIHGNLNQCATATGRLSSTNPNMQNVTNRGE